jgi:hypothetical protein
MQNNIQKGKKRESGRREKAGRSEKKAARGHLGAISALTFVRRREQAIGLTHRQEATSKRERER